MSGSEHGGSNNEHRSVIGSVGNIGVRSASPAKRSAADMEDVRDRSAIPTSPDSDDQIMSGLTPAPQSDPPPGEADGDPSSQDTLQGDAVPSIDEQVRQVMDLAVSTLDEGSRGFVVSYKWLNRVLARTTAETTHNLEYARDAREGPVGPVDNSDIVADNAFPEFPLYDLYGQPFVPLSPKAEFQEDFQIVPERAWELISSWYGLKNNQRPIVRYAHNTAEPPAQNIIYELHPPVLTIQKSPQPSQHSDTPTTSSPSALSALRLKDEQRRRGQLTPDDAIKFVSSRKEKFQKFLMRCKEAADIPRSTPVRLWKVLDPAQIAVDCPDNHEQGAITPPESPQPLPSVKLVLDRADFQKLKVGQDIEHIDAPDETNNSKYNGRSTMDLFQLFQDNTIILEELIGSAEPGGDKKLRKILNIKGPKPPSTTSSGQTSPSPGHIITRGRARRDGRTRGTVGLSNLGNTCYMNSALQCIRSVEELSYYFLMERYKREINASNPLGHGGAMAKQYAGVLNGIYGDSSSTAFSPNNFKRTLGMVQPLFSGYGQQDSQEFLSFLVDALHEDLNRIQQKPYNENPDSDDKTVHDPQAIIDLGEIYRKNHKARNDSVAMDLFSGFYKNTMECPVCDKISITFDPYSLITLQLPIENTFRHTVTFMPLHGRPVRQRIDIDKNQTIKALKQQIASKHSNVAAERLWIAEVYNRKLYRIFEDHATVAESNISANDHVFVYELESVPRNGPQPSKSRAYSYGTSFNSRSNVDDTDMNSAKAEQLAVPIYSKREPRQKNSPDMILHPLYITLTRAEAQDYDVVFSKIIAAVSRVTSRPILTENPSVDDGLSMQLEPKVDPISDDAARISDGSVPSEDGYVKVSLAKVEGNGEVEPMTDVEKDATSHDRFRNLFKVYFCKSSEGAQISSLEHNRLLPMQERVRPPGRRASDASNVSDESHGAESDSSSPDTVGQDQDDAETESGDEIVVRPAMELEEEHGEASLDGDHMDADQELPSARPAQNEPGGDETRLNRRRNTGKPNKFGSKRKNKNKIRGKKERKGRNKLVPSAPTAKMAASHSPTEGEENIYFIRLGEGIVLEWTDAGYDALFGGDSSDENDMRGHFLSDEAGRGLPQLEDPVLDAQHAKREARKHNGITLDDCFSETGKREILSEDNAWYCNRCKEMRQAAKTLEIWTIPEILIVHLKRFGGNRSFRDKIDVKVDYPIEGLDMTERIGLKEDGKEYVYDLFAVDNHYGGLGGGHYTAMAKNFYDRQWYDYNDSTCSKIGEKKLHSAAAYLLFYRRRSEKPLGPQYLQDLVLEAQNPTQAESAEDDEEAEAGEGQLGGPDISLHGSLSASAGAGAGAENQHRSRGSGVGVGADSNLTQKMVTTMNDEDDENDSDGSWQGRGRALTGPMYSTPDTTAWSFDALDSSTAPNHSSDFEDDNMSTTAANDDHDSTLGLDDSDGELSAWADGRKSTLVESDDAMHVESAMAKRSPTPTDDIHLSDESME